MEPLIVILIIVLAVIAFNAAKGYNQTPAQRDADIFGPVNASMICPHCQASGTVHTMQVSRKRGISGGKATAAVMTGGISMLATGLSRKENLTQAHCGGCNNTWTF